MADAAAPCFIGAGAGHRTGEAIGCSSGAPAQTTWRWVGLTVAEPVAREAQHKVHELPSRQGVVGDALQRRRGADSWQCVDGQAAQVGATMRRPCCAPAAPAGSPPRWEKQATARLQAVLLGHAAPQLPLVGHELRGGVRGGLGGRLQQFNQPPPCMPRCGTINWPLFAQCHSKQPPLLKRSRVP